MNKDRFYICECCIREEIISYRGENYVRESRSTSGKGNIFQV